MGLTCRRPLATLSSTMNDTMSVTISRRGTSVVLANMLLNTGTSTMIGMALSATANGVTSSLTTLNRIRTKLSPTPQSTPNSSPTNALAPVTTIASYTFGQLSSRLDQIADGDGSRNGWMSNTRTMASQVPRNSAPTMSGGTSACPDRSRSVHRSSIAAARARSLNSIVGLGAAQRLADLGDLLVEEIVLACVLVTRRPEVDVDDVGDPTRSWRHHHHTIGEIDRLRDRVGDEDHRGLCRRTDPQQLGLHVFAGHLVERAERLIHQQQRWMRRQCTGDRHALLHAARQLPGQVRSEVGELDELQHLVGALATLRLAPALQFQRQLDVPADGSPLEQPRLLERHPVVLVESGLVGRLAVHQHGARGGLDQVRDQAQQGRLATA